jgi:hypothetical protein
MGTQETKDPHILSCINPILGYYGVGNLGSLLLDVAFPPILTSMISGVSNMG